MDEIEFAAETFHLFRFPGTAWFPAELKFAAFGAFEKMLQIGDVFGRWCETGGRLKEDEEGLEFVRDGIGLVPRPANGRVETEVAAMLRVMGVEGGALVRGAGGTVGDDLQSFEREPEIGGGSGAPTGGGCQFWESIKGGIDLDARK